MQDTGTDKPKVQFEIARTNARQNFICQLTLYLYSPWLQPELGNKQGRYVHESAQSTKHTPGNALGLRTQPGITKQTYTFIFEVVTLVLIVVWGWFDFVQIGKLLCTTQNILRPQCTHLFEVLTVVPTQKR